MILFIYVFIWPASSCSRGGGRKLFSCPGGRDPTWEVTGLPPAPSVPGECRSFVLSEQGNVSGLCLRGGRDAGPGRGTQALPLPRAGTWPFFRPSCRGQGGTPALQPAGPGSHPEKGSLGQSATCDSNNYYAAAADDDDDEENDDNDDIMMIVMITTMMMITFI